MPARAEESHTEGHRVPEFQQDDERRYLRVEAAQSGAADRIRLWRAHCRRHRRPAVTVIVFGSSFHLEIGWPAWWPVRPDFEAFWRLPGLRCSGSSGSTFDLNFERIEISTEEQVLRGVLYLLDIYASEELRVARRETVKALPASEVEVARTTIRLESYFREVGRTASILEILPDWEYAVLSAGLDHLFGALPLAVPLAGYSIDGYWDDDGSRLDSRFPGLSRAFLEKQGRYLWEPRFREGLVKLQTDESDNHVRVSRPARQGNEAIFWLEGQTLTEHFRGFLRLLQRDGEWRVEERSHDEDWRDTVLDGQDTGSDRWDGPRSLDPNWKRVHLDYPQAEPQPFRAEARSVSNQLYQELIDGSGDPALQDIRNLTSLHGGTYSWRHLAVLARQQQELLWELAPSELTRQLHAAGIPVLAMADAPASTWKLLAHLNDTLPCRQASWTWALPQAQRVSPRQQGLLDLLDRILQRAECRTLQLALAYEHQLAFQSAGESLARLKPRECIFEQTGVLWIRVQESPFGLGIFDIVGELCRWGDPGGQWRPALWKAAVIETARLESTEEF